MTVDISTARWFKSRHSSDLQDCVEVAHLAGGLVGVRDSKAPATPPLIFTAAEWDAFLSHTARGRFTAPS